MHKPWLASLALALVTPVAARAQAAPATTAAPTELNALRQEINALRASYETRMQALELRLQAAEAGTATSANLAATATAAAPAPAPASRVAAATATAATPPTASANAFNPAISLILSGLYQHRSRDPAAYTLAGFPLPVGTEAGPGGRGFSLAESELGFAASIDPWWRGSANIALHPDNTVSVEEAYIETTALGNGVSLKAGRFLSGIGYLNAQHAHTWDFVDNPLAYQAMLGTQYGDDGLQLRWVAATEQFIELGAEIGRGRSFPGGDNARNGAGMVALTAHAGGDLGDSQSWRAGLSVLRARAETQALTGLDSAGQTIDSSFSGTTRVWIADAVWKWAPNGNATRTNLKLQGEWLQSTRSGNLGTAAVPLGGPYRAVQSGGYLQGVYQFMPAWRLGLRAERLTGGQTDSLSEPYASPGRRPSKTSLMLDYSASEFSRIRLQFAQDRSRRDISDGQISLQYQMSLGAHGAHRY